MVKWNICAFEMKTHQKLDLGVFNYTSNLELTYVTILQEAIPTYKQTRDEHGST